jgi:hypothetical protein
VCILISAFTLILFPREATCYEGWIGSIHYRDDYKANSNYSTPQKSVYHFSASCRHDRVVDAYVKACFADGALVDARAKVDYDFTHEESCDWTQDHEICCGGVPAFAATWEDRKKGCNRVSPGDKGKVEYDLRGVRVGNPKINSVKLNVGERLGMYNLLLDGTFPARWKTTHRGTAHLACSGEERSESPPFKVSDFNEYFSFSADAKFSGDTIKEQRTLVDIQDEEPNCFAAGCSVRGLGPHPSDASKKEDQRTSRVTARWHFKKTDCFGVIRKARGDVRIKPPAGASEFPGSDWVGPEGWPAELGCIDAPNGTIIETGAKSRVMIDEATAEVRLGSNASVELKVLCAKGEASILNHILGVILYILPEDRSFKLEMGSAATGVRGEIHPFPGDGSKKAVALLRDFIFPVAMAKENELGELMPNEEEIKEAKVAFLVDKVPDEYLYVKMIKGVVKLQDSAGNTKVLKAGQSFTKRWKLPVTPSELKEIFITVDMDSLPVKKKEKATESSWCQELRTQKNNMKKMLDDCLKGKMKHIPEELNCEMFQKSIDGIDQILQTQCK